jgi:hypothetical protein
VSPEIDQDAAVAGSEEIHLLPPQHAVSAPAVDEDQRLSASGYLEVQ